MTWWFANMLSRSLATCQHGNTRPARERWRRTRPFEFLRGAQGGISASAASIVLGSDPGPVIDSRSEPVGASLPHFGPKGLTTVLGNGYDLGLRSDG